MSRQASSSTWCISWSSSAGSTSRTAHIRVKETFSDGSKVPCISTPLSMSMRFIVTPEPSSRYIAHLMCPSSTPDSPPTHLPIFKSASAILAWASALNPVMLPVKPTAAPPASSIEFSCSSLLCPSFSCCFISSSRILCPGSRPS